MSKTEREALAADWRNYLLWLVNGERWGATK